MTPITHKRKSRLADGLAIYIKDLKLNENDETEVITLSLKTVGLPDKLRLLKKPSKSSKKLTPSVTKLATWDYWHKKSKYTFYNHLITSKGKTDRQSLHLKKPRFC